MPWIQFYWNWFSTAFNGAWAISQGIAGAVTLIAGIIVWKLPKWEASMKNLLWMIPLGLFLILVIIRLVVAPYNIYRKQEQQLTDTKTKLRDTEENLVKTKRLLEDAIKQIPPSLNEIMMSSYLKDRDIPLASLGMISPTIRNKVFDNCRIYGPAVITPTGKTEISDSRFSGDPESSLITTTNERVIGVIALEDCKFLSCHFVNVSFIGNAEIIAKIRAGFTKGG